MERKMGGGGTSLQTRGPGRLLSNRVGSGGNGEKYGLKHG